MRTKLPAGAPNPNAMVVADALKDQTVVGYTVDGRGLELHFDNGARLLLHPYSPLTYTEP